MTSGSSNFLSKLVDRRKIQIDTQFSIAFGIGVMEVQASKNCNESELEYHQFQSSLQQIILVSLGFYFYDISDIAYDTSLDLIRKHLE